LPVAYQESRLRAGPGEAGKARSLFFEAAGGGAPLETARRAPVVSGVVSGHDFTCCQTCGHDEIWDEIAATREDGLEVWGYTFYYMQDTERAGEGRGLYLCYGAVEDGEAPALRVAHEVVDALQRHGLKTEWDGTHSKRIKVHLDWKRRLPWGGG
jgi:hypothetical protein